MEHQDETEPQPGLSDEERTGKASMGLGVVFLVGAALLAVVWWIVAYSPMAIAKSYKFFAGANDLAGDISLAILCMMFLCLCLGIIFMSVGLWQRRQARAKPYP